MLISPMLFIVRGPCLLVSHRGGASGALRPPLPDAASLRYASPPTKPLNSFRRTMASRIRPLQPRFLQLAFASISSR